MLSIILKLSSFNEILSIITKLLILILTEYDISVFSISKDLDVSIDKLVSGDIDAYWEAWNINDLVV